MHNDERELLDVLKAELGFWRKAVTAARRVSPGSSRLFSKILRVA